MGLLLPFRPAEADYPNHLSSPWPERLRLPAAWWLMTAMVLLCIAPRAMMAHRLTSVCPDGVLYIHIAKDLEAGNLQQAFRGFGLNLYPIVLAALHRAGFDWALGAALWGITVSSLVVLPLWGWLRRQFDDRVALLACMLYAVHPEFIEWSPEVMRDPTFWLLFTLAIYCMWRAITEIRLMYFIAAGAAIFLASLTRIEGIFLLIPLALWTFWRWLALGRTDRHASDGQDSADAARRGSAGRCRCKLILGLALCVGLFPAILVLVNLLWLPSHHEWSLLRLDPLERVRSWLAYVFSQAPAVENTDDPRASMTVFRMAWIFFPIMTRGLSPVFALLMFGGLWGWRRVWSRRDHQPLCYVAVAIMGGIWIHLWYDQNICPRYALPIVLLASPFAALGLLALIARLSRFAGRRWPRLQADVVATVVFGVVFAANLTDAMTCSRSYLAGRRADAEIGRWVSREFPRPAVLVGPLGLTQIAGFYADDLPCRVFRCDAKDEFIIDTIQNSRADVVLLRPAKQLTEQRCAALADRCRPLGFAPVRPDAMPIDEPGFVILVRADRTDLIDAPPPIAPERPNAAAEHP